MNNLNLETEETKEFFPADDTVSELEEKFTENGLIYRCKEILVGNGWKVDLAEKVGGSEGEGETYYLIYRFYKEGSKDKFFKIPGWYQSYHGGELEWHRAKEVFPKQKMVTYYE